MAVVNQIAHIPTFALRTTVGTIVTGKINGDWTKTVFQDGSLVVSVPVTVTEVPGASGYYDPSFTPPATGEWVVELQVNDGTLNRIFTSDPIQVETASQDDPVGGLTTLYGSALAHLDANISSRATVAGITDELTSTAAVSVELVPLPTNVVFTPAARLSISWERVP